MSSRPPYIKKYPTTISSAMFLCSDTNREKMHMGVGLRERQGWERYMIEREFERENMTGRMG